MIRKHVDLIALGVLLGGFALFSHTRAVLAYEFSSFERDEAVQARQCLLQSLRKLPKIPRISFSSQTEP
jgi:hypothetical protein